MRHLRLPLTLIVIAVLAFGLIKGLMYWQVKRAVDDLARQLEPQAQITYGSISTELSGVARVHDIQIKPHAISQTFEIEQVMIASDDVMAMLGGDLFEEGEPPPEQMTLSVLGLNVPLDAQLAAMMQASQGQPDPRHVCDRGMQIDPAVMSALGFESFVIDMDMQYRFDVPSERFEAGFQFELREIESLSMDIELVNLLPEDLAVGGSSSVALVAGNLEVSVQRAFGDRFMRHCAQQKGVTVDAYRESLLASVRQDLTDTGVVLGSDLNQALQRFYTDFGNLTVHIRPEQPLGAAGLVGISPERVIDALGLHLFVNEQRIADVDFQFDMARMMAKQQERLGVGAPQASDEPLPGALPPPRRVQILRTYEPVLVSVLDQHLGAPVRIKPRGQPLRQGKLVAIVDGEAVIEQRAHGGSFTSYVRLEDIESAKVERVERKPIDP